MVVDAGAHQGNVAATGGDLAVVDHAGVAAVAIEVHLARHEVVVADVEGAGGEATGVDVAGAADGDAVGVDQDHATGVDGAVDARGLSARYSTQEQTTGVVDRGRLADVEALVVDHRAAGGLVDGHGVARVVDAVRDAATLYRCACGQGMVWRVGVGHGGHAAQGHQTQGDVAHQARRPVAAAGFGRSVRDRHAAARRTLARSTFAMGAGVLAHRDQLAQIFAKNDTVIQFIHFYHLNTI